MNTILKFPYFMKNQRFKDFFQRWKEVEEIMESYPNSRDMCYLFEILLSNIIYLVS